MAAPHTLRRAAGKRAVLALAFRTPYPRPDGSALRIFHLMRELSQERPCHLVTFGAPEGVESEVVQAGVFRTITHLALPTGRASPFRHLRLGDETYWRRAYPAEFRRVTEALQALADRHQVAVAVATDLWLAEFVAELQGVHRVVDECDCLWLTMKRRTAGPVALRERLASWVHTRRVGRHESRLTSRVDLVTTVSPVDRDVLRRRSRTRRDAIQLVPNGVAPALVTWDDPAPELPNSVAFWGNLDFPPNQDAVRFFCREVFQPHLRGSGITVYLIGRRPPADVVRLAEGEPQIKLTGFVDDLFGLVSRIPVVVNPMVSGSGIKNKVLEAFALRRAVISTRLGMEGIQAVAGEHFIQADAPAAMAKEVQALLGSDAQRARLGSNARDLVLREYTWGAVGAEWRRIMDDLAHHGGQL